MIYLIQPQDYPSTIGDSLRQLLANKQLTLQTVSRAPNPTNESHTYFIINDSNWPSWSGLDWARVVRHQDRTGNLILLADQVDYTALFRTHLCFLDVITFDRVEEGLPQLF